MAPRSLLTALVLAAALVGTAQARSLSQTTTDTADPASWAQQGTPQECTGILSDQWTNDEIECHVCNGDQQLKCEKDTDLIGDDSIKCEIGRAGLGGIVDNAYEFDCNVDKSKKPMSQCDWAKLERELKGCAWEPVRRILATWQPTGI